MPDPARPNSSSRGLAASRLLDRRAVAGRLLGPRPLSALGVAGRQFSAKADVGHRERMPGRVEVQAKQVQPVQFGYYPAAAGGDEPGFLAAALGLARDAVEDLVEKVDRLAAAMKQFGERMVWKRGSLSAISMT